MDSGITQDQDSDTPMDDASQVCVPLADLSIDGQTPSVGDTVDFAIEAKVVRVDGDMAYVQPTSVNGKPVEPEDQQATPDSSAPSFDDNGSYMGQ